LFNYILLFASVILNTSSVALSKLYQMRSGANFRYGVKYNLISGTVSALAAAAAIIISGGVMQLTWYSVLMAMIIALSSGAQYIVSFKAFESGGIVTYVIFSTLGSIFIPSLCGFAFLKESISMIKWIGFAVLTLAVVFVGNEKSDGKKTDTILRRKLFFCFMAFLLSGLTGWFSKLHQADIGMAAVSLESFALLVAIGRALIFGVVLICLSFGKQENNVKESLSAGAFTVAVASALASGVAYIFVLSNASALPAAVMFPVSTGGSLVLSALTGRMFFRERLSRRMIVGLILAVAAVCMFF